MAQHPERKRALIVDDDESLSILLARQLDEEGFTVLRAENTEQALKAAQEGYSVALVDLALGAENGWACVRRLRERWPGPVVVMTGAFLDDEAVEDARLLGAAAVLQKPFEQSALMAAVRSVTP